jgi:DNA repair exonuclease SbcCD ATPase subunit
MKIKSLKIKNILSIEEANVEFGESGLVLVEGFDYDTGRANGAGKSAIFNALSFALYDKVPRKITKSEIMRKGAKQASADVVVSTNGGTFRVVRTRPVAVEFYKDDEKLDISQEEFESKIGINYDQFLTTMYNAQDSQDRFVFLNDRGKKEFLLKIMNLGDFNQYKKHITNKVNDLSTQKKILETKLEGFKNSVAIYKKQIVDPQDIKSKITQLDSDIDFYNNKIKSLAAVSQPDVSKYADIEVKVGQEMQKINNSKFMLQRLRTHYDSVSNLKPDTNCPSCNVELIITDKDVHVCDNSSKEETLKDLAKQINELESVVVKEAEYNNVKNKLTLKKQEEFKDYNAAQASLGEYKNSVNFKIREKETLETQLIKNEDVKKSINDIVSQAQAAKTQIANIDKEVELLETVGKFFDPTGAPAYIMDSVVDSFNDSVTDYINHIWPNASYSLQTYKENKDKTITSKFSEILMINGKATSIGSLSGGELRALSLAIDFAMVDILSGKFSIDLNPIILDEPFNGLDTAGKELVIELLEKLGNEKEIWVVDHASEAKSLFSRTVRVEKRNGTSQIMDE